jgi:hypothetical protein
MRKEYIIRLWLLAVFIMPSILTHVDCYAPDRRIVPSTTTTTITTIKRPIIKSTCLFSTPPSPQERQPRRFLQKRPRKNRKTLNFDPQQAFTNNDDRIQHSTGQSSISRRYRQQQQVDDFPWDTAEIRTVISAAAREAGEDYWIDEIELQKIQEQQQQKQQLQQLRRTLQQQNYYISDSKLWYEILQPYKQNWIGLISVSIIIFAFIFKYFPEVIDPPIITNIPDIL